MTITHWSEDVAEERISGKGRGPEKLNVNGEEDSLSTDSKQPHAQIAKVDFLPAAWTFTTETLHRKLKQFLSAIQEKKS